MTEWEAHLHLYHVVKTSRETVNISKSIGSNLFLYDSMERYGP